MDNKIELFVLKPNGKIGWIQEPVKVPAFASSTRGIGRYNHALQYAIDNAVEVSNQEEVEKEICDRVRAMVTNHPYPLQCSVEKKEFCEDFAEEGRPFECPFYESERHKTVALVTFSQPEEKKERKQLLSDLMKTDQEYGMYDQPEREETQEEYFSKEEIMLIDFFRPYFTEVSDACRRGHNLNGRKMKSADVYKVLSKLRSDLLNNFTITRKTP